jgi:hypothetical protein
MTQGALSKAIRIGRKVYVTLQADGSFAAIEFRAFPARHDREVICGPTLNETIRQMASYAESDKPSVHPSSAEDSK